MSYNKPERSEFPGEILDFGSQCICADRQIRKKVQRIGLKYRAVIDHDITELLIWFYFQ
jgi:hypothetical protein